LHQSGTDNRQQDPPAHTATLPRLAARRLSPACRNNGPPPISSFYGRVNNFEDFSGLRGPAYLSVAVRLIRTGDRPPQTTRQSETRDPTSFRCFEFLDDFPGLAMSGDGRVSDLSGRRPEKEPFTGTGDGHWRLVAALCPIPNMTEADRQAASLRNSSIREHCISGTPLSRRAIRYRFLSDVVVRFAGECGAADIMRQAIRVSIDDHDSSPPIEGGQDIRRPPRIPSDCRQRLGWSNLRPSAVCPETHIFLILCRDVGRFPRAAIPESLGLTAWNAILRCEGRSTRRSLRGPTQGATGMPQKNLPTSCLYRRPQR
jgi:hypothetical protein